MLLTIYIPTYGRAPILYRLLSILAASVMGDAALAGKIEIVVADNCSVDTTAETVKQVVKDCAGVVDIKYHCNAKNIGALNNFIQAPHLCSGEYVWLLGDDDIALPHQLRALIDEIELSRPDILFLKTSQDGNSTDSGVVEIGKMDFFRKYPLTSVAHISRLIFRAGILAEAESDLNARPSYYIWCMAMPVAKLPADARIRIFMRPMLYVTKDGGMEIWTHKTVLARLAEFVAYCKMVTDDPKELATLLRLNFPDSRMVCRKYVAASILFPDQDDAFRSLAPLLEEFKVAGHPMIKLGDFLRTGLAKPVRLAIRAALGVKS